jgi:hypothetical protein
MPKNADLQDNLVDDLVEIVDDLRSELYLSMGNRQHEVSLVRRTWSGGRRGVGTVSYDLDEVIDPPPLLTESRLQSSGDRYELLPTGRDEQGGATLTEISLQYTEDDLTGGTLGDDEEFYYRVTDLRGQALSVNFYVVTAPPSTDRQKDIGWVVSLLKAHIDETVEETP